MKKGRPLLRQNGTRPPSDKRFKTQKGFSLIESSVALSIFLFVLLGAFQVYSSSQSHFTSLKQSQETTTCALAALDKMKTDILKSGLRLSTPAALGLLKPISKEDDILFFLSSDHCFFLEGSLIAGQTFIPLSSTQEIKEGNEICIFDDQKGEVVSILLIEENSVRLSSPLSNSYAAEETSIVLLKKICFYLDESRNILRRKVNSSPAQPLCEDVGDFYCAFDAFANLVEVKIILIPKPEKYHEIFIFPKNTALAANARES